MAFAEHVNQTSPLNPQKQQSLQIAEYILPIYSISLLLLSRHQVCNSVTTGHHDHSSAGLIAESHRYTHQPLYYPLYNPLYYPLYTSTSLTLLSVLLPTNVKPLLFTTKYNWTKRVGKYFLHFPYSIFFNKVLKPSCLQTVIYCSHQFQINCQHIKTVVKYK